MPLSARLKTVVLYIFIVGAMFGVFRTKLFPNVANDDAGASFYLNSRIQGDKEFVPQQKSRVVIAGLFQNNGKAAVQRMHKHMKETVDMFDDHLVVILENDSTDETSDSLREICKQDSQTVCLNLLLNPNVKSFMRGAASKGGRFAQERFTRIAFFRNMVLDTVKLLDDFDYFVFVDPDLFETAWTPPSGELRWHCGTKNILKIGGPSNGWATTAVANSLTRAAKDPRVSNFTAICSYGTFSDQLLQYDMLAFRLSPQTPIPRAATEAHADWSYNDWNLAFSAPEVVAGRSTDFELHCGMVRFGLNMSQDAFVPVQSCFGGMTIYNLAALRESGCRYDALANDCEHVSLNTCLDKFQPNSIFVDTGSKVFYDSESFKAFAASRAAAAPNP